MRASVRTAGIITALTAGLLATGCASSDNDPGARTATRTGGPDPALSVPAWYGAGGATLTTKLGADLNAIGTDAIGSDTVALKTHCDTLTRDVGAATNYPPIPDTEAQQHWSAALRSLTAVGRDCSNSADAGDTALLGNADKEINAAAREMSALTKRVNTLGGQA